MKRKIKYKGKIEINYNDKHREPMENIEELYILGCPIITEIGHCRFLKVREYKKLFKYVDLLALQKFQLIRYYQGLILTNQLSQEENEYLKDLIEVLNEIELIMYIKHYNYNMKERFKELFKLCFGKDVFELIQTDEQLDYYRDLIIAINNLPIVKENPNPEIEEYNRLERELATREGGNITFKSVYTSVWAYIGEEPYDMTLYSMYALFNRISCFKNYEATTLFMTVSNEVKMQHWYEDIQNVSRDKVTTLEELEKQGRVL